MKKWNIDRALTKFKKLRAKHLPPDMSEADTRAKLIDSIFIDCLGWNESDIQREERCLDSNGLLDYKFSTNMPIMIVEAKKESVIFDIPQSTTQREFKIGGVLKKCTILISAMNQAKEYAISKGITFCAVTNGDVFVVFRAVNQQGVEWTEHKVAIFRSLEDIENNFDEFCKYFSKYSAEQGRFYNNLRLESEDSKSSANFQTLDTSHLTISRKKNRNKLFPYIGRVVRKVFQDLASNQADSEILEHCYVGSPRRKIRQKPHMDQRTEPLQVTKKDAGEFQQRIVSILKNDETDNKEVILLLGSVGVGKSTFIQRFRKVLAKREIDRDGIWVYLNFKQFSDTGEQLNGFVFKQIEKILGDEYKHLNLGDWNFIKQAYHSDYEKLKRGALAPLFKDDPNKFEIEFGTRVNQSEQDDKEGHFVKILNAATKNYSKQLFLVFDNADQLNPETQKDIFLLAQRLSEDLQCHALIAMREESYWKNRDAGPLNAFYTTAYHVQPATISQILSKRFSYAKNLISKDFIKHTDKKSISKEELIEVFDRLVQTFLGQDQSYIEFIESTSNRNIRRALDNVASFMISGHTNIDAILRDVRRRNTKNLTVPFHEFLNAVILRDHETYTESSCDIINLFNVVGNSDASNFNKIAVLGCILNAKNTKTEIGTGYVSIDSVINNCSSAGILPDTCISILTQLNTKGLIETETTIKDKIEVSEHVRITTCGDYYINKLYMTT